MLNLNYSIAKIVSLFFNSFSYPIMTVLIICSIILFVILKTNNQYSKYIMLIINIILILMICYYYHQDIFTSQLFHYVSHNIYFVNNLLFLIIMSIVPFTIKNHIIIKIIYCIELWLLSFSLFMTSYLNNNTLLVIGNIYPMIVIGNYILFIFYFYLLFLLIRFLTKKK